MTQEQIERDAIIPRELAGERLDRALGSVFDDLSRVRLSRWIKEGHVALDGKRAESVRTRVLGGERVCLRAPLEHDERQRAQPIALDILYQDESLLILSKPPGLVVHPGAGNPDGTLLNGLLHFDPSLGALPRAGLVHRIDKDTSGALVVARTMSAHLALTRQLAAHAIKRGYVAVVHGEMPTSGTVDAPIRRHARLRTRMTVAQGGRNARTHFKRKYTVHGLSALELELETGRTHQIRVHMSHLGHPIVGDRDYGGVRSPRNHTPPALAECVRQFQRQALHAHSLELEHPLSAHTVRVRCPLPADLAELLTLIETAARETTQ